MRSIKKLSLLRRRCLTLLFSSVTLVADDFRKEQLAYFYEKDTAEVLAF